MIHISWSDPQVRAELKTLKSKGAFVYGLTNYIAANLSANVLLAVGAGPAIGTAMDWPTVFGRGANAMWINTAALMSSGPDALLTAARSAHEGNVPWALDPVAMGAGAPEYDAVIAQLLQFKPTAIRGNASELIALSGGGAGGKGVETTSSSSDALAFITELATRTGAIVAVSGPTDYITDGKQVYAVSGGDKQLTQVTGAGCSLGAFVAALLAHTQSPIMATVAAHAAYAVAAERAAARTRGTGSFAVALVDELSLLGSDI
jgi:hydroxyethylthiazole kinase